MSLLNPEEVEQEQYEMRDLQLQLLETNMLVKSLSVQLNDLKERVSGTCVNITWNFSWVYIDAIT